MAERIPSNENLRVGGLTALLAAGGLGALALRNRKLSSRIRELEFQATHDELTGLLNTRGLEGLLSSQVPPQAILYVDGTNQKAVNDKLGHDRGDMAIIGTAEVLQASLRPQDIAARIGGDEFLALLNPEPRTTTYRPAEEIVGAVIGRMHDSTQVYLDQNPDLREIGFDIAVGGAVWQAGMSVLDLRQTAESNMYEVKSEQHDRGTRYR